MTASEGTAVVDPPPWGQVPSGVWFLVSQSRALSTAASTWGGTGSSGAAGARGAVEARSPARRQATTGARAAGLRLLLVGIALISRGWCRGGGTRPIALQSRDADVVVLYHLSIRRRAV